MLPGSPGSHLLCPGPPGLPQPGPVQLPLRALSGAGQEPPEPPPRASHKKGENPSRSPLGSFSSGVTGEVILRPACELSVSDPKCKLTIIEFISSCHRSRHQWVRPFHRVQRFHAALVRTPLPHASVGPPWRPVGPRTPLPATHPPRRGLVTPWLNERSEFPGPRVAATGSCVLQVGHGHR